MRLRVLIAAAGILALPFALAAPVAADAATVVTTFADLQTAVTSGDPSITLGADITAASGDYLDVTGHTVILDLAGHTLTITAPVRDHAAVEVPAGASFTLDDSHGGGALIASGASHAAGVGGGDSESSGTVIINGGTNTITGAQAGAGVGGGDGAAEGTTIINGGTNTITGGLWAAGIGGGFESGSGITTITGGATTATGGATGAGIGNGAASESPAGSAEIQGTATSVSSVAGGNGTGFMAGVAAAFTNSAGPTGVSYTATSVDANAGSTTIVFHYLVTIAPENGDPATTETIDYGGTATAPTLTRAGYKLVSWQTSGGAAFSFSTPITAPVSVDAVWQQVLATTGVDPGVPAGVAALLLLAGAGLLIRRHLVLPREQ